MRSFTVCRFSLALRAGLLIAVTTLTTAAEAQTKPRPQNGPAPSSRQFTLRREEPGGGQGAAARGRARTGDCEGALPLFDAALRVSIEPTLRRDRGLCHEKLNHPYPAMDDYREYLVQRPNAEDADQIRARLAALEEQHGMGAKDAVREEDNGGSYKASAVVSATTQTEGSGSASSSSSSSGAYRAETRVRQGDNEKYDDFLDKEREADLAYDSPLRYGQGFVTGLFLHIPRHFIADGKTSDMGYSVGATLRYALGKTVTLVSEIGYAGIGSSGTTEAVGGPLLFFGPEFRFALERTAANQLFLGFGVGYENYTSKQASDAVHLLLGRGRFGYRHVFGSSIGLDLMLDGGLGNAFVGSNSQSTTLVGGSVALLVAF